MKSFVYFSPRNRPHATCIRNPSDSGLSRNQETRGVRRGRISTNRLSVLALALSFALSTTTIAADWILHNGKIVTVDERFTIATAIAFDPEGIVAVGDDSTVLSVRDEDTQVVDLEGKMVLPGLIDSHTHPGAAMTEFDHELPRMESIENVLDYVRTRAAALEPGEWIAFRQVFITRLREQRYPTREELDRAAPNHPVVFATGPDAVLNSLAMRRCGIDKEFEVTDGGPGYLERDPETGEPTGLLRGLNRFVDIDASGKTPSAEDYYRRTLQLLQDYNSVGLTTIADRNASVSAIRRYQTMRDNGDLPVRIAISHRLTALGRLSVIKERIADIARHPLRAEDPMLRIIGVKVFLDGGMLTGSAYMREPWGVSEIYGITDPEYRGVLNIPPERLVELVRASAEHGLQFTAHSVGDGAVHTLIDAYERVGESLPIRETRPSITHSNFMTRDAVEKVAELGIVMDIQPAWLYLDTRTLVHQFGYERLRYFQPLRSLFEAGAIAGGGSDHMQKIGSMRAVNPYNPFLGMWVAITRQARWHDGALHPEEALTREQAIQFYTRNNAYLLFLEDEVGSLETGKRADLIVVDRDLLTCPVDGIKDARVLRTYLNGALVYSER